MSSFASTASTFPFLASAFALSCLIVDHRLSIGQYCVDDQAGKPPTYGQTVAAPTVSEIVGIVRIVLLRDLSNSV